MSLIKKWRPISVTNSDYKFLAKYLALSLSHVIHDIINKVSSGRHYRSECIFITTTDDQLIVS